VQQHEDDDDDVFGLLDSLPRGPGDRFTIEDLVPMKEDLHVDPTSLLPADDDGVYGGDELDVPESSSGRKRCVGHPPKQYVRRGGGASASGSGRGRMG